MTDLQDVARRCASDLMKAGRTAAHEKRWTSEEAGWWAQAMNALEELSGEREERRIRKAKLRAAREAKK